jgi:hypothetical protein
VAVIWTLEIAHACSHEHVDLQTGGRPVMPVLITRGASVGVIGQKRPPCIYLESSTYDWFGLPWVGRNGFDSRWPTLELKRITPDRLCVDQEEKAL